MATKEVLNADAFDALDSLPSDYAHAAVIDYPWEFQIRNGTGRMEYRNKNTRAGSSGYRDTDAEDSMFNMESDERLDELFGALERVLVDGAWVFCLADDRFQDVVRDAIRNSELILRRNWAWSDLRMRMGTYGRVNHYPIPTATNGDTKRYVRDRGTLVVVDGAAESGYSTAKPTEVYRHLLAEPVLRDGERLLEPFCGSAPGAAVAAERGLSYWGCDVEPEAVDHARSHFQQHRLHGFTDKGGDA